MVSDRRFIASSNPSKHGPTILVLEDEGFVRQAICKTLLAAGYGTLAARTAIQARNILSGSTNPVSLLLIDLILPGENGFSFACELKMRRPEIKIIFFSGYTDSAIAKTKMDQSTAAYLAKPFAAKLLLREVTHALE